jgi:serine/threonine protein kinase
VGHHHASEQEEYDTMELLGQGATGLVHRAVRRSDGKQVALKRISTGGDPEVMQRAQAEFEIMQKLDHRNIIRPIELKFQGTFAVLVMEFFRGGTLQEAVTRAMNGYLAEGAVRNLARELLIGLQHVHDKGVVHRDLKPQNVMVTSDLLHAKIIDLGSAHFDDHGSDLSPASTRLYAAPEVLQGAAQSAASDVWAVGLCLYFALSGKLPQGRDRCSRVSRLSAVAGTPVDFSGPCWEDSSPECVAFLRRCLLLDESERPTASELLQDPWMQTARPKSSMA